MTQGAVQVPDFTQGPKDLSPRYKPLKMGTKLTEFRKKDRENKTFMRPGTKKLLRVKEEKHQYSVLVLYIMHIYNAYIWNLES